jgi:hypothetical protein
MRALIVPFAHLMLLSGPRTDYLDSWSVLYAGSCKSISIPTQPEPILLEINAQSNNRCRFDRGKETEPIPRYPRDNTWWDQYSSPCTDSFEKISWLFMRATDSCLLYDNCSISVLYTFCDMSHKYTYIIQINNKDVKDYNNIHSNLTPRTLIMGLPALFLVIT